MRVLLFIILLVPLVGCVTQTFLINGYGRGEPAEEDMQLFWVGGIGQSDVVNASRICGGAENVAKVVAYRDTMDNVYAWITFGIFTPATAMVYCNIRTTWRPEFRVNIDS